MPPSEPALLAVWGSARGVIGVARGGDWGKALLTALPVASSNGAIELQPTLIQASKSLSFSFYLSELHCPPYTVSLLL
jgi:hypothetical protein